MRIAIVIIIMLFAHVVRAQNIIQNRWQPGVFNNGFNHPILSCDSGVHSKWSFSKQAGVSMGYSFFRGGNASFVSVPLGIKLNRRLTNNLYAFTGVSVAPSYINFNSAFIPTGSDKTNGSFFTKGNTLGLSSRVELGLMYVNDAKTFSISGSIGMERNSVPVYSSAPVIRSQHPASLPQ